MAQRIEPPKPYPFKLQFQQDIQCRTTDSFRHNLSPDTPSGFYKRVISPEPSVSNFELTKSSRSFLDLRKPHEFLNILDEKKFAPRLPPSFVKNPEDKMLQANKSLEPRWNELKLGESTTKLNEESTFMTKQNLLEDSALKFELSGLKEQLEAAGKRIAELQTKNKVLEMLAQDGDLEISKFKQSQFSTVFSDSFSEGDRLIKSARMLQSQRDEAECKRKNMENILIMQDTKMKDKECLIKVLTEKINEGARQHKELEKQLISQSRKVQEFQRRSRRKSEGNNSSQLMEALARKQKEISVLKSQILVAKELLQRKEESSRQKEESTINKLNRDVKRLSQEVVIKEKQVVKEKQSLNRARVSHQQVIKKMKEESEDRLKSVERELALFKDSNEKNLSNQEDIIRSLRDRIGELSGEISSKDSLFMRDKDQTMQELVSHESTIRTLQYEIQKGTQRERLAQEEKCSLQRTIGQYQAVVKKMKEESNFSKEQSEREVNLMKDKETYQRLLISQEATINSIRVENTSLKEQVHSLQRSALKSAELLADKETLHKILIQKEESLSYLKSQNQRMEKQIGLEKQLLNQKQVHLRTLLNHSNTIADLKAQNAVLQKSAAREKSLSVEKENLLKLLLMKDEEIKCMKEEISLLTVQCSRFKGLAVENKKILDNLSSEYEMMSIQRKQEISLLDVMMKEKEDRILELAYYQGLAGEREQELINREDVIQVLERRVGEETGLKQNLNKLVCSQQVSIMELEAELACTQSLLKELENKYQLEEIKCKQNNQQKEYWMNISSERQVEIASLKSSLKELQALSISEMKLLEETSNQQKLITIQSSSIAQLKQELLIAHSETKNHKQVVSEKDGWMKLAHQRDTEIKRLVQENACLSQEVVLNSELIREKESYQILLAERSSTIENLAKQVLNLQQQAGKETLLSEERDNLQKLVKQQNQTISSLREQVRGLQISVINKTREEENNSRSSNEKIQALQIDKSSLTRDLERSNTIIKSLENQILRSSQSHLELKSQNLNQLAAQQLKYQQILQSKDRIISQKTQQQYKLRRFQTDYNRSTLEISTLKQQLKRLQQSNSASVKQRLSPSRVIVSSSPSLKQQELKDEVHRQQKKVEQLENSLSVYRGQFMNVSNAGQEKRIKDLEEIIEETSNELVCKGLSALNRRLESSMYL